MKTITSTTPIFYFNLGNNHFELMKIFSNLLRCRLQKRIVKFCSTKLLYSSRTHVITAGRGQGQTVIDNKVDNSVMSLNIELPLRCDPLLISLSSKTVPSCIKHCNDRLTNILIYLPNISCISVCLLLSNSVWLFHKLRA